MKVATQKTTCARAKTWPETKQLLFFGFTPIAYPLSFEGSRCTGPCSAISWSAVTPETSQDLMAISHSSLSFLSLDTSVYGLTSFLLLGCGCRHSSVGEFRTSLYAFNVIVFFTALVRSQQSIVRAFVFCFCFFWEKKTTQFTISSLKP